MKRVSFLTGFLLMMTILFNTIPALASPAVGHLDSINGNCISGWAWDSANPDIAQEVLVVVTNQRTGQVVKEITATATEHREDLKNGGTGTGDYGFTVTMEWDQAEDGFYIVDAYINGNKFPNTLTYLKGNAETASVGSLRSLGQFRTTAYCPCYSCSAGWGRRTSTGATATANHTIAVDPKVIPYGSKIMINGVIYTAEDRGGGVRGNHIDIFFNSHSETTNYGNRHVEVFLVQ